MDLSSRLRAIVKSGPPKPSRELTYEPDTGRYEATIDLSQLAAVLGGRPVETPFGRCLIVDRRYEADRWHGSIQIGQCEVDDLNALWILDPALSVSLSDRGRTPVGGLRTFPRTVFIDLETTGLSGGAGTVAFLVGCGFFDLGAFQVRQFLLTSYASERALLWAVAEFFKDADLIVTYNGKSFDVPVMETRWLFHRLQMPLDGVPHFDMVHPARRLWRPRAAAIEMDDGGCRLGTLERTLFEVNRVGDVGGFEVPARFFRFLRSGDPRPLEAVLEHNRFDLVSLAAVMARAVDLVRSGHLACRDCGEALALGRVYERAAADDRISCRERVFVQAGSCYQRGTESRATDIRAEALYRLALWHRRERRFAEAAAIWREVLDLTEPRGVRRMTGMRALRRFAAEALAIHHEHRDRDLDSARELALFALEEAEADGRVADGVRHRLARLNRKIAKKTDAQLLWS
ncbi:MAG TPA: ribonuclease H-like domain-containing protein [Vicinamibacterales bacterium]|nr:ribonuclease H-like domain-containing protein [Vicinamibacterales bacterium]